MSIKTFKSIIINIVIRPKDELVCLLDETMIKIYQISK